MAIIKYTMQANNRSIFLRDEIQSDLEIIIYIV